MYPVDLRSDTVTQPTRAMREAMAAAEVGDDVFGDDPTVIRLEGMARDIMEKEASLFVPSGTMGNLIAVLTHCRRGDEAILGDQSHTFLFEAGGIAALGGVHPRTVPTESDGTLSLSHLSAAIRNADDLHQPPTRLICVENTHNMMGGLPLSGAYMADLASFAKERGLLLHVDGARIFDAAAALDTPPSTLVRGAHSVTFCLSKGLAAPVGSVLCGAGNFIAQARRIRKQLGGGMRQVGVLAAAGITALETMRARVSEDHIRAKRLAAGLSDIEGIVVDPEIPATNMVFLRPTPNSGIRVDALHRALEAQGIRTVQVSGNRIRLVVHYEIDDEAVEFAIEQFRRLFTAEKRRYLS